MLNDVSCPEVEELMDAFKTMTTVVKFANVSLESGNMEAAHKSYTDALILFKKLKNDRGVSRDHEVPILAGSKKFVRSTGAVLFDAERIQHQSIMTLDCWLAA